MALTRGIQKAVDRVVEELHKMAEKIDDKDEKEITEVATIAANNDPEIGKKLAEAMEGRRATASSPSKKARRPRPKSSSCRACSSTAATCRRTSSPIPDDSHRRAGKPVHPHLRRKDLERQEPDSAAGNHLQEEGAAAHHRRGHRRRSPGDAGGQQAQGHPAGLCGQGPRATAIAARPCSKTSPS